jgi:hypothetical protein
MTTFDNHILLRAYAALLTGASMVAVLGGLFVLLVASGSVA